MLCELLRVTALFVMVHIMSFLSNMDNNLQEQTPLEQAAWLSDLTGNHFLLKREDLQPVGHRLSRLCLLCVHAVLMLVMYLAVLCLASCRDVLTSVYLKCQSESAILLCICVTGRVTASTFWCYIQLVFLPLTICIYD